MPDRQLPPNPDYEEDDDIPFRLPRADNYYSSRDDDLPRQRELSDEELRAQDVPLPEDKRDDDSLKTLTGHFVEITDSVSPDAVTEAYSLDDTEEIEVPSDEEILARHKDRKTKAWGDYDPDEDVPFKLPRADATPDADKGQFINQMHTLPRDRQSAPTLAGSGGLDPNPDFAQSGAPATMRSPVVPPQDARFQRPAAHPAPPPTIQQPRYAGQPHPPQVNGAPRPLAKPRKRRVGCMAIFLGVFVTFCGGMSLFTMLAGMVAYARVGDLLNEQLVRLDSYEAFQSTFVLDRNGRNLFEVFNEGRRTKISFENIPQDLINATVAIEDGTYWTNIGVDIPATTVAFLAFIGSSRDDTPGGSTITQQLVRNVLFDPVYRSERSVARKVEEIALAVALTGRKSKEEILELYLNEIYYGNLAYGIQAASQIYFGKDARDLTLGEAALLAGLPQAPAELDPLNPDPTIQAAVERRWRRVLDEMVKDGYITSQRRDQVLREGYTLRPSSNISLRAPHFTVYARNQLERLMTDLGYSPEQIARGGLRVYTTIDLEINDFVQATVTDQISRLRASNNVGNGAVVVIKPITGEILAMVGSANYDDASIDGRVNVTTALRQPGSTVKIFTYAAALERGMTPGDVIWDTRTQIGIPGQPMYEPRNYDGRFHGPMRMRGALANSYNIPAVQTLRHNVGVDYLLSFMRRMGISTLSNDPSFYGLSLTLGGGEVALIELTNGFAAFANQGVRVSPQSILCVVNNNGVILYQYENSCPEGRVTNISVSASANRQRVLDERIAFIISDILGDNAARTPAMGANSPLNTPGIFSAVKTGTTNDVKDNWTVGYTRNVAVGVWVGNSRGEPMRGTSGLTGAAPIWNTVITGIYNNSGWLNRFAHAGQLQNDQLVPPPGVSRRPICDLLSLQDPAERCGRTTSEWFLDSPAGIPTVDGGMEYPPIIINQQAQQPPATGSFVWEDSPGVYRTIVQPVPPEVAAMIQFEVAPGRRQPPPPRYCRVPMELLPTAPAARELLFIEPPPDFYDAAEAEEYARSSNLAFLPNIDCSADLLTFGGFGGTGLPIVINAFISSPAPGQSVPPGGMPIIGTVDFAPGQVQFYRFLIQGGNFPEWTTIGNIQMNPVNNGQLEFLPGAPGLQPGNYLLKLEVIAPDSSLLQEPYVVPFRVE